MSKLSSKTTEWLKAAEQKYIADMPEITEENRSRVKYMQDGLKAVQEELALRLVEKKSESQSVKKIEQLPTKQEMQGWAKKEEQAPVENYVHIETSQKQPESKTYTTPNNGIKTIKAPVIDREPEYINIELTDQKGEKYIRTYNRAQTKALCRKYFSNIHNTWVGGNRKLTNGFDNLVAFFLGWVEFDGSTPELQDVLQDYFRYKKVEASGAFKAAQELYDKIISVIPK